MENNEHLDIAKIIERKILNDNVVVCEQAAYNDKPYEDKLLSITDRKNLLNSILKAIQNGTDLNNLLGKDMSIYTLTDLNDYYKKIKKARETSVDSYISMLKFGDFNTDTLNYVNYFLETHTYLENIEMKKCFLKGIGIETNQLSNDEIDKIFYENCEKLPTSDMKERH
jgi:hypothetical protein